MMEYIDYALAIILLVSSLIAVNKIRAGYSDLRVWLLFVLGIVLVIVGFLMWVVGDWPAAVLVLTGFFALYRGSRRTGLFVFRG